MTKLDKAADRTRMIIRATHVSISENGVRQFTLRSIAQQCDIHLKTLQHYFPTRNDLLKAVFQERMDKYLPPLMEILHSVDSALCRFNKIIDQLFDFSVDIENQRFFTEIFSMAQSDPQWMALVDTKFELFYNRIGDLISELNPDLDREAGRKRALAMGSMMEGMMLFLGENKPPRPERDGLDQEIRGLLLLMAQAPRL
ncbi:TetR/AcrR family transcriptional regulator [Paremcibacter congregatus]|uniref:HTH tetR-type domain-containing protein n=1 Tax=Paremcibacter congregatus TaxID=2043170 RepID=A0A2G4YSD6_9PROT|nr:TetR family transcriptional regulator [Paremcibacter congregatus]PHZ85177.1 hypothetical protein CRD36_07140 [Paremcibacter congregatus]QDE27887.1 TetR/AcrR family transcriptional regulator [Paremcibacter congregatus]